MITDLDKLTEDLLKLPTASRGDLAERLLESVDDFADPEVEKEWRDEVRRRVSEYEEGAVSGVPADEVREVARKRLNEARVLSS